MPADMAPPLRAVLFDLDGTVLDTAPDMVGALNVLRLENREPALPYEDVRGVVSHGSARRSPRYSGVSSKSTATTSARARTCSRAWIRC
jgi:phosphoglycolate phosphatase